MKNLDSLSRPDGFNVTLWHMLEIQFGGTSGPGGVPADPESAMGSFIPASSQEARSHGYLFAVADGRGCLDRDKTALAEAISRVVVGFAGARPGAMLISLLPELIEHANAVMHQHVLDVESFGEKPAAALVTCALRYNQAVVSHVGDSSCYLVRDGAALPLTRDHPAPAVKGAGSVMSRDPWSRMTPAMLRQALGPEPYVVPDTVAATLYPGDVLVLCTRGVDRALCESRIAEIVAQRKSACEIAHELVAHAAGACSRCNATAQVIRVRSVEERDPHRRAAGLPAA